MKQLTIPYEVADNITLATLLDQRTYLQEELDKWNANPKTDSNPTGYWMHPDDVVYNTKLINALNVVINYYGG